MERQVEGQHGDGTPGYIVQAKVFEKALAYIANGADTLDAAVDEINENIEANSGYGH